jgi:hypothetical protein
MIQHAVDLLPESDPFFIPPKMYGMKKREDLRGSKS